MAIGRLGLVLAVVGLAACSGGGTGGSSFAELADAYDNRPVARALLLNPDHRRRTRFGALPTTGSVTYDGVIAVDLYRSDAITGDPLRQPAADSDFVGQMQMTVDFGANSDVTGRAHDFVNRNGGSVRGQIVLSDGTVTQDGFDSLFVGVANGRLTTPGGNRIVLVQDQGFYGGTFGDDADVAVGFALAPVRASNTRHDILLGRFVLDK